MTFSNNTILPPRYVDDVTVRYYFDIAELVAAGQSIDDITIEIYYDEESANSDGASAATISDPIPYGDSETTYYVEISWQNCIFYGDRVFHFALIADMDGNYETNWDASNDYSQEGLLEPDVEDPELTELITAYVDGELVWGIEPDGAQTTTITEVTTITTTTTTTASTTETNDSDSTSTSILNVMCGDTNLDGDVTLSDVVLLNKFNAGAIEFNAQATANIDCNNSGTIDASDSLALLRFLVQLIDVLPYTEA